MKKGLYYNELSLRFPNSEGFLLFPDIAMYQVIAQSFSPKLNRILLLCSYSLKVTTVKQFKHHDIVITK